MVFIILMFKFFIMMEVLIFLFMDLLVD